MVAQLGLGPSLEREHYEIRACPEEANSSSLQLLALNIFNRDGASKINRNSGKRKITHDGSDESRTPKRIKRCTSEMSSKLSFIRVHVLQGRFLAIFKSPL